MQLSNVFFPPLLDLSAKIASVSVLLLKDPYVPNTDTL